MKTVIKAMAPTSYQTQSLRAFGMDIKKHGNGSYSSTQEFPDVESAKEYLRHRAEVYTEKDCNMMELQQMHDEIDNFGQLTLDAVTAHIEEVEDEE